MNALRQTLRPAILRPYSTTRRPFPRGDSHPEVVSSTAGASRRRRRRGRERVGDEELQSHWDGLSQNKAMPASPTFYTGRSPYYDKVTQLQNAIVHTRVALKALQLLPLPEFARQRLPPIHPVWKDKDELASAFQSKLTTGRYRQVITLLNELNGYLNIAITAQCVDLGRLIGQIIGEFESGKKAASLATKKRGTERDSFGRSYTLGKRKTSSARVWMIPVHAKPQAMHSSIEEDFNIQDPKRKGVTTTSILVNNIPLAEYFPIPADRERITRPLKIAGVLGAYNVFSIIRGGGTSGQSGALAHGITKGLVVHKPELQRVLKKAQLLRRDPRMVERKKTGLAKARKRYAWVKR